MLFKSLKAEEELSCAALVKGIENTGKKTSYFDVKLRPVDAVFSLDAYMWYIKHCGIEKEEIQERLHRVCTIFIISGSLFLTNRQAVWITAVIND